MLSSTIRMQRSMNMISHIRIALGNLLLISSKILQSVFGDTRMTKRSKEWTNSFKELKKAESKWKLLMLPKTTDLESSSKQRRVRRLSNDTIKA